MAHTASDPNSTTTLHGSAPTHCVFRHGRSWLALPAPVVREVMPRQEMVVVPGTPATFVGLCHVRSEFIPVLNLGSVLPHAGRTDEQIMLVLEDTDGPWAFLIDEVVSLQELEISDAPDSDSLKASTAVIGWATFGETVIQVLDQDRIRQFAEQELADRWRSRDPLHPQTEHMSSSASPHPVAIES
jgi:chemotaxis signal transduction protein